MIPAPRARVRKLIASHVAGAADVRAVGAVALHESQSEAVRRAQVSIRRFGGVLLADDVGTGKTYIALALAATYARVLVVAPASLREMWTAAARRASVRISFTSMESLPGARPRAGGHDVVLIDEAHHLRNPATKRYAAVRAIAGTAKMILLSATPIHNRARDLDAELALFLGADARDLDPETRAIAIVRGVDTFRGPSVVVHEPLDVPDVDAIADAFRTLPAPVTPRDGGDAPTLVRMGFLRAWCSSNGAATAMVRRAQRRASALLDAMRAGAPLSRRDLRSWIGIGEDQLAFTELLSEPSDDVIDEASAQVYADAIGSVWMKLKCCPWVDDERAAHLRTIVRTHADMPVLACSQYTATVEAMWHRMRLMPGVAMLTSRGARIASGRVSRDDVLARFAPRALGARPPHERERIHLLIATDIVSEGLNLHDAGVVVHLDTPWTAARMAQRVGRIARLGSPHREIHSYMLAPPRAAAALLALEQRIAAKRRVAARLVGGASRARTLLGGGRSADAAPETHARVVQQLQRWAVGFDHADATPLACGVAAGQAGWLALIDRCDRTYLVARIGRGAPTTNPATILRAVRWLVTGDEHWLPAAWEELRAEVDRWIDRQRGRQLAGALRAHAAREQSRTLAATMASMAVSRPHDRARVAAEATNLHLEDPRFTTAETSVRALVVFCRGDESD